MGYKPGDIFYTEFISSNVSGVPINTDNIPSGALFHNCLDDFSVPLYISNIDAGRYSISGLIPSTYTTPSVVGLVISGYIAGNLVKGIFDFGPLDRPVSVTGIVQANIISSNPGITVSVTGNLNVNVVTISGQPLAAPNSSGAILSDLRFINNSPVLAYNGICVGGSNNSIKLAANEPSINQFYQYCVISLVGGSGSNQFGFVTSYSGNTQTAFIDHNWLVNPVSGSTQYSFIGYNVTNPNLINNQLLGAKAGINFNTFFQDNNITSNQILDNFSVSATGLNVNATVTGTVQANVISSNPGVTMSVTGTPNVNIISINPGLTISVTGMAPINFLPAGSTVSVTGISQVNIVSSNPGITFSVTGTVLNVLNIINPVSITGLNTFSAIDINQLRYKIGIDGTNTVPTNQFNSHLELSTSGFHNIMLENNVNAGQLLSLMGAVIAGSSVVNGNSVTYYAVNNNAISRVVSTAISGSRNSIVLTLPNE